MLRLNRHLSRCVFHVSPMPEAFVVDSQATHLRTVFRWLKREHLEDFEGMSGFYLHRSIIRKAFQESEMKCLVVGRIVVGFATIRLRESYSRIELFEIRPGYRNKGYGRQFAAYIIRFLLSKGAPYIAVECSPQTSESFWRSLGFETHEAKPHMYANPKLWLRAHGPNSSLQATASGCA